MKSKLPTGVSVVIALVLVAFGLLFGTWRGYTDDQKQVEALLSRENGLMDVLNYRAADGLNLCVVARRHLPQDSAELARLEEAAHMAQQSESLLMRREADRMLGEAAEAVSERLRQTASFQASERDGKYLDMLWADLSNLSRSAAVTTYNEAAKAYNESLNAPVSGWLAKLMGMKPCALYE